jgi:hypothetical protein
MHFDVFNGDADGICALIQLRLDRPLASRLITGIKRDIQLLDKFTVTSGDRITVLDISLQTNSVRVKEFLNQGCSYFLCRSPPTRRYSQTSPSKNAD